MDETIAREEVEQFIRDTMEPISYSKLINEFSNHSKSAEQRKNVKAQLEIILHTAIDSGSIVQYRGHFFSSYLPEDLESVVNFMEEQELPSDISEISFSSCESIDKVKAPSNKKCMDSLTPLDSQPDISFDNSKHSTDDYLPESKPKSKK